MELNKKLQQLRKQKALTQEELAECLYVSRTAISKWESGRGYPSIESLKAISKFFGITLDELLSGDELLSIAEEEGREKEKHVRKLAFGLLDCSAATLLFLPLFGDRADEMVRAVSLPALTALTPFMKPVYFALISAIILWGILGLALQNCRRPFWERSNIGISLILNAVAVILFTAGLQPYAAVFLFVFLSIKVLLLINKQ